MIASTNIITKFCDNFQAMPLKMERLYKKKAAERDSDEQKICNDFISQAASYCNMLYNNIVRQANQGLSTTQFSSIIDWNVGIRTTLHGDLFEIESEEIVRFCFSNLKDFVKAKDPTIEMNYAITGVWREWEKERTVTWKKIKAIDVNK